MNNNVEQWIQEIKQVASTLALPYIYVIVDQTGHTCPLVPNLTRFKPEIRWCSLFENEPEKILIEDAPLFLRIEMGIWQHENWLESLLKLYDPSRLLLFFSPIDFNQLALHLQNLIIVDWEGRKGIFRFYDTRIFPTLIESILTEPHKHFFLDMAKFWTWRNRDGEPVWLPGQYQQQIKLIPNAQVSLTDKQFDRIGYISDIEMFMKKHLAYHPELSREHLFNVLWDSLIQAEGKKVIIDSERFFADYLIDVAIPEKSSNNKPKILTPL